MAARIQRSPPSRRAIRAKAAAARGSRDSPRENAAWNLTRGASSFTRANTASSSFELTGNRFSDKRSAFSRMPGSASLRANISVSSSSDLSPASDQSACSRAGGNRLSRTSVLSAGTTDVSCRS